jgi:hypothetical protein
MATSDLRMAYLDLLMNQVLSCKFPSPPMLDRLEAAIRDPETGEEYVRALIDLISEERFSSPAMLERVSALIYAIERS